MRRFTSTATKDGRWWVVQCDQEPGALSQVARLDQAADAQREAIALVSGVDESEIEVVVTPALAADVRESIATAQRDRAESARLAARAAHHVRIVAADLAGQQYSLRDIGLILGVSHQRVAQLLASKGGGSGSGA